MPANDLIFLRLHAATAAELSALAAALDEKLIGERAADVSLLSQELRADAGSSFANIFRDKHELPYRQILEDVVERAASEASWKAPKIEPVAEDVWLEDYIVEAFAFAARKKDASPAEKSVAQTRAEQAIAGKSEPRSGPGLGYAAVGAAATALVGGIAFGALLVAALVASPAMKRVIPAVMVLIHIRKRLEIEKTLGRAA